MMCQTSGHVGWAATPPVLPSVLVELDTQGHLIKLVPKPILK